MIFIVALIALVIERFFDWSHLRRFGWLSSCETMAKQKIPGASPYAILAATLVPLLALLITIQYVLSGMLYGFVSFVLQLVVVIYCLGPQNLWADAFAAINALTKGDAQAAADKLQSSFHVSANQAASGVQRELLNQIYISANARVFAVIFWYGIAGLPGAAAYRLLSVSASGDNAAVNSAARLLVMILDWLPVRVISFLFALGGNFTRVFTCWLKGVPSGFENNNNLIDECGLAAIISDADKMPQDGSLEKSALALLDRVFIITLALMLVLSFVL